MLMIVMMMYLQECSVVFTHVGLIIYTFGGLTWTDWLTGSRETAGQRVIEYKFKGAEIEKMCWESYRLIYYSLDDELIWCRMLYTCDLNFFLSLPLFHTHFLLACLLACWRRIQFSGIIIMVTGIQKAWSIIIPWWWEKQGWTGPIS